MHKALITGSGGAIGALARYGVGLLIPSSSNFIPYGTLFINGIGSFILACLTYSLCMNGKNERLKLFFGTGFYGGFTTMSTFAFEVTQLTVSNPISAFIYLLVSMAIGLLMAWLGYIAVSRVRRRLN